jgi:hypothetical protein
MLLWWASGHSCRSRFLSVIGELDGIGAWWERCFGVTKRFAAGPVESVAAIKQVFFDLWFDIQTWERCVIHFTSGANEAHIGSFRIL